MAADWVAIGRLVRAERRIRGLTQTAFAGRYGMSVRTLSDIELGKRDNFDEYTRALIEDAILQWTPGSLERTLAGGTPEPKPDDDWQRLAEVWHVLSPGARAALVRIADALRPL